jgi:hypothetical protein
MVTNGSGIGRTATDASVFTEPQMSIDAMQRLADRQSAPVEIDVGPREAERLTSPQSHRQRDRHNAYSRCCCIKPANARGFRGRHGRGVGGGGSAM